MEARDDVMVTKMTLFRNDLDDGHCSHPQQQHDSKIGLCHASCVGLTDCTPQRLLVKKAELLELPASSCMPSYHPH